MSRSEFSKQVKRDALKRSGGKCEAIGKLYGLKSGQRCNMPLSYGVDFDHVIADSNGGEATLENCASVCKKCHRFKTDKHDTPRAAKITRVSDKRQGIRGPKHQWAKQSFNRSFTPNVKQLNEDIT